MLLSVIVTPLASVDIRPALAELLTGSQMSSSEFDEAMQKSHGIHQRAVSKFDISSSEGTTSSLYDRLPSAIVKASKFVSYTVYLEILFGHNEAHKLFLFFKLCSPWLERKNRTTIFVGLL